MTRGVIAYEVLSGGLCPNTGAVVEQTAFLSAVMNGISVVDCLWRIVPNPLSFPTPVQFT